jgi:O-antigen ligase/tetratricopeptide (TPR) repeat protein
MSAKTYLRILQGGLILSLLIVFFVFRDLLFPFITSKQLPFNILMEILLAIWLVFILRYPAYRPRRSYISIGLLAYLAAILASCAVSVDFNLSFWGDAERMLGLFHLTHFFIFYLILITAFRSWREWSVLLLSSVIVATGVSLIGLFGPDIHSTIGNTTYVSGYLIFNLFFAAILFIRSRNCGRWLYLLPVAIMLVEFGACRTSGAFIGLTAGVLLFIFLLGAFHKKRAWRRTALIAASSLILVFIILFSNQSAPWFKNSFLRDLSFAKPTFQTRLISWRAAVKDFKNHRLFGTGFGNYAVIFDKHFDSKFFSYATTETYFDRAHNNLIDIGSTTGLVGLITYLSIFAAALYYLIREFKKNGGRIGIDESGARRNLELSLIIALLGAYFVQNLAVFDSFVTYIGLMMILGFIYWRSTGAEQAGDETENEENEEDGLATTRPVRLGPTWENIVLIIFLAGALFFAYQFNIKPWRTFAGVIEGYSNITSGRVAAGFDAYHKALRGGPLDRDGRTTFINLAVYDQAMLDSLTPASAAEFMEYAIDLARQNVAQSPFDSLIQMQLAQILDMTARFYYAKYPNPEKVSEYSAAAMDAMEDSLAASPGRAPVHIVKAQMLLSRGEPEEAIKTIEHAISLNPDYPEGYCRLAQFFMVLGKDDEKYEMKIREPLDKCAELNGAVSIGSPTLLMDIITYYSEAGDYEKALYFAERLAEIYGEETLVQFNLAKLYLIVGQDDRAEEIIAGLLSTGLDAQAAWDEFKAEVLAEREKAAAGLSE